MNAAKTFVLSTNKSENYATTTLVHVGCKVMRECERQGGLEGTNETTIHGTLLSSNTHTRRSEHPHQEVINNFLIFHSEVRIIQKLLNCCCELLCCGVVTNLGQIMNELYVATPGDTKSANAKQEKWTAGRRMKHKGRQRTDESQCSRENRTRWQVAECGDAKIPRSVVQTLLSSFCFLYFFPPPPHTHTLFHTAFFDAPS